MHLELSHNGFNLVFECLIGNFTSPKVDFVPDQDDGYLPRVFRHVYYALY